MADEADAKIRAIVSERDELIQDLEALVLAKAVLTDNLLPVASDLQVSSEEATDYSDMSLSSESDFNGLLFDVSIDAATDDSISDNNPILDMSLSSDSDSLQFDVSLDWRLSTVSGGIQHEYDTLLSKAKFRAFEGSLMTSADSSQVFVAVLIRSYGHRCDVRVAAGE